MSEYIIKELERSIEVFSGLLNNADSDESFWKPKPEKWCLLEIVCHLHDEEISDFRTRVRSVLENPENPLPPIDPVAWATNRKYIEQDFDQTLSAFIEERKTSVEWLRSLKNPNWENVYKHPKLGSMSARLFLSNWLAHDYLHQRQILQLRFAYLKLVSSEDLSYAGNW